jgi:hypothetical protein
LAAKYLKVLIPYLVVLVDGILAVFWYLKEYLLCLIVIKSCKYKGLVLFSFNLNGNIIKCEDEVKLLGVTIDFELNFNAHIANLLITPDLNIDT